MKQRKVYLSDIPLESAMERFWSMLKEVDLVRVLRMEEIPLDEKACGRVLAEPVWAKISSPHYHASAMDGFAVRADDTVEAKPTRPVTLNYPEDAVYVDTGDPIPEWANAVIPVEMVEAVMRNGEMAVEIRKPDAIRIRAAVPPWSHIRSMGEDIVATELVLPAGQVLRPVDLGALAASGCVSVLVSGLPKVSIIPTGNELVKIGDLIQPGSIIEFNSIMLAGQVNSWGGKAERFDPVSDQLDDLCKVVQTAADRSDLVLINAGSSAGSEDYTAEVVQTLGELLVHGVAIRPGHPVILGWVRRSPSAPEDPGRTVPVIGVPGYPVSTAITGEVFVEPLLACWTGRARYEPARVEAQLTRKITSPGGDDDYVRVVVGKVSGKMVAAPLHRCAGVINSLARADGLVVIPRGVQGVMPGETVSVRLLRLPAELERTILAIGSHDLTIDVLAQHLARHHRRLSSANAGSLDGLMAIKREEAHLAGIHLLDPQTGIYNLSYVNEYLGDKAVALITWVRRMQGLILPRGNPKSIQGFPDLRRQGIHFVNRQRGSGTRILLDFQLQKNGIDSAEIEGYAREEYTHLAVAAAVASGRADCGLGIEGAASALGLDFIPLEQEQYDLVLPCEYLSSQLLSPMFDLMNSSGFQQEISRMPGYDASRMGEFKMCC